MNRLVDYTQNSIKNTLYTQPYFRYEYISDTIIGLRKIDIDSGSRGITVPFSDVEGNVYNLDFNECVIDINYANQNTNRTICGRIDSIALIEDIRYILWAFADSAYTPQGFGISQVPYSLGQSVGSGTKGNIATFTNLTKAYRYTKGARIRAIQVMGGAPLYIGEWNLGTIQSIDSDTQIKVLLDNHPNYGTNLVTNPGVKFEQLNDIRPYKPDNNTDYFHTHYQPIGAIDTFKPGAPIIIQRRHYHPIHMDYTTSDVWLYLNTLGGAGTQAISNILKYAPEDVSYIYLQTAANSIIGAGGTMYVVSYLSSVAVDPIAGDTIYVTKNFWIPMPYSKDITTGYDGKTSATVGIALLGWGRGEQK